MACADRPSGAALVVRVDPALSSRYPGGNFAQGYPFAPRLWPRLNSAFMYAVSNGCFSSVERLRIVGEIEIDLVAVDGNIDAAKIANTQGLDQG